MLAHPAYPFLATEREKVHYFTTVLGVDFGALPVARYPSRQGDQTTSRCFVDKFPIYLLPRSGNGDSEPGFCFIDPAATTVSGFETYLERYRPLYGSLSSFRVVYAADKPMLFGSAEKAFQRFLARESSKTRSVPSEPDCELFTYFEARRRYESGDLASFDRTALLRLRDQRARFSAPEYEARYASWRIAPDAHHLPVSTADQDVHRALRATFSVCLLDHNYDLFGSLTSL